MYRTEAHIADDRIKDKIKTASGITLIDRNTFMKDGTLVPSEAEIPVGTLCNDDSVTTPSTGIF